MKMIIEIKGLDHIPEKELAKSPFDSELEFYIDLMYTDPYLLLDGAIFELIEIGEQNEIITHLRQDKAEMLQWLGVLLDMVDYTSGACTITEMVGAVLPKDVIENARAAIANATK